jgi:hypothetical protein
MLLLALSAFAERSATESVLRPLLGPLDEALDAADRSPPGRHGLLRRIG